MSNDSDAGDAAVKEPRKIVSDVTREKARLFAKRTYDLSKQVARNSMGLVGTIILVAFILMGIFGEQVAPYEVLVGGYDQRFGATALPTELGDTQTLRLSEGGYGEAEGVFIEKPGWPGPDMAKFGLLRVTTEPSVPTTIYVDGIWRNGGELNWAKLPIGEHRVSFSDVPGYITPDDIEFVLEGPGLVTEIVGEFVECGTLNVSVEPSLPVTIFVNGFPRGDGGLNSYFKPGAYEVSFGVAEGYDAPEDQTVIVTSGETAEVVGVYSPNPSAAGLPDDSYCSLRVVMVPDVPSTVIVNTYWTSQGSFDLLKLDPLEEGEKYAIQFTDVPGYLTPNPVSFNWTTMVPGELREVVVEVEQCALLEAHTSPSISSTIVVNGIARNDWSLSVYVPEGTYHVTFRTVQDYAVPEPDSMKSLMRMLPLVVFLGASVFAMWVARKQTGSKTSWHALQVAALSLIITSGLLGSGLAGEAGLIDSDMPTWAYALGLAAVTLSMLSIGLMQNVIDKNVKMAMITSLFIPVPYALTMIVDLGPFALADARLSAYGAAGAIVAISAFLLTRSFRYSILAYSAAEDARAMTFTSIVRTVKLASTLVTTGLILSGLVIYLVQHWTTHWMGTNNFGADILSELLLGAKTSILVGVISAAIASVLGAVVGLYSGYVGGWVDEVIMRLNDIVLSIPWLVLMIIIAAMVGKIDLTGIILIIGLTGWSPTARMVRAQVLSIRERQFIERARAIGSGDMGIIGRHVLPNAFPLVFANTILTVAVSILSEATLSFLGMRPVGTVTWGTMLSYAQQENAFMVGLHSWILAPGVCIVLIVLGFSLLGYAFDDIMNPKLRKR